MQILKAFFKIAYKLKGSLIMYVAIFIFVGVTITSFSQDTSAMFEQQRLDVAVFDEDGTPESKALYDFIAENHNIVEIENDPEKLWDMLYYHEIQYVLTIEKGYSEKIKNGETENLLTYSTDPQSYSCEYINMQLRQYISSINIYLKSGMDFETAKMNTSAALENTVKVTSADFSDGGSTGENTKFIVFMRFLAYVMPAVMITVLARVIIELRGENIRNRTFCSPVTTMQYNGQIIGGSIIFCFVLWSLLVLTAFFFGGFPPLTERVLMALINSFVFMLISAGIGVLISMCLSRNSFVVDMIANILCLGMSFLCGVFVDQYLLTETVLKVGQFLPAYWYVSAINNIGQVSGAVYNSGTVWNCIGIELLFAAALFAVSLAAAKFKRT